VSGKRPRRSLDALLISPPVWSPGEHADFDGLCPPLGLAYLAASLIAGGASVEILDLGVVPRPASVLARVLREKRPAVAGVTSLTQNYQLALQAARLVKREHPEAFLVMGGPHVSYQWEQALQEAQADAVVLFEAEETFPQLVRAVIEGEREDVQSLEGLAFTEEWGPRANKRRPHRDDLDSLPFPARGLLPLESYARRGTIMTSRGCPEKCIFCLSSTYEGRYRPRGADSVVDEIGEMYHEWGIREFHMLDNVFTVDAGRVKEICRRIVDEGLRLRFSCVSRADLVTPELVGWLAEAGCSNVEIGVESGAQAVVDGSQKNLPLDRVEAAAEIVLSHGILPMFTFQLGSPFDSEATMGQTRELARRLRGRGAVTFFSVTTPFPGTPLARRASELGVTIRARSWRDYRTSNPIMDTPGLTRQQVRAALFAEYRAQALERMAVAGPPGWA
jgi:radical SAM superfamily enzyme YgiQ (UPF0313 family)